MMSREDLIREEREALVFCWEGEFFFGMKSLLVIDPKGFKNP
jgi:hypothetical protein